MQKLYFEYGTMKSSKTANALMTKFNYEEAGTNVLLIKPAVAIRDGAVVKSRIGLEAVAELVAPETDIVLLYDMNNSCGAIIVDECQFLKEEQIDQLRYIVDNYNIPVFCYGLRTDFTTHLFEGSKRLMEIADEINEIKYICSCGQKAIINARVKEDGCIYMSGEQIDTHNFKYIPMCSRCYQYAVEKTKQADEKTLIKEIQEECFW